MDKQREGFSFISNCQWRGKKARNVHQGKFKIKPRSFGYQAKRFDQLPYVQNHQAPRDLEDFEDFQGFQAARLPQDTSMGALKLKYYMRRRGVCGNTSMCDGLILVFQAGRSVLKGEWQNTGIRPVELP